MVSVRCRHRAGRITPLFLVFLGGLLLSHGLDGGGTHIAGAVSKPPRYGDHAVHAVHSPGHGHGHGPGPGPAASGGHATEAPVSAPRLAPHPAGHRDHTPSGPEHPHGGIDCLVLLVLSLVLASGLSRYASGGPMDAPSRGRPYAPRAPGKWWKPPPTLAELSLMRV